jgi:hypothetical protein
MLSNTQTITSNTTFARGCRQATYVEVLIVIISSDMKRTSRQERGEFVQVKIMKLV